MVIATLDDQWIGFFSFKIRADIPFPSVWTWPPSRASGGLRKELALLDMNIRNMHVAKYDSYPESQKSSSACIVGSSHLGIVFAGDRRGGGGRVLRRVVIGHELIGGGALQ